MKDHPSDEFDTVPEQSSRQGVHRRRLIPARSAGLALKTTVGVLGLLIVVGAFFLLPRLGLTGNDGVPGASVTSVGAATPTASQSVSEDGSEATDGPTSPGDTSTDREPSGAATDRSQVTEDQTQAVNVLNGTGSPGLATVAAGRLAAAGWTSAVPGNWTGAPLDASVVFYNGEAQRSSAEAVAEDLEIGDVIDSPDVSPDITVVLGPEFE